MPDDIKVQTGKKMKTERVFKYLQLLEQKETKAEREILLLAMAIKPLDLKDTRAFKLLNKLSGG